MDESKVACRNKLSLLFVANLYNQHIYLECGVSERDVGYSNGSVWPHVVCVRERCRLQ